MRKKKDKTIYAIFVGLLLIALLIAGIVVVLRPIDGGLSAAEGNAMGQYSADTQLAEKWQEGIISYEGKDYIYNPNIDVYLFLGIDKDGPVEEADDYVSGGQADAIFLLVTDSEKEELSIVSVQRNTMTDIQVFAAKGTSLGTHQMQLCLQHGYGDGKKYSCMLTESAVSKLFYNLPISGYMAINMGGIPMMNDSIGGVTVEVLQDLSYPDVELKAGETVTLQGMEAYYYLRGRDTNEFDSATLRLRRQEQYLSAYFKKLHEKASASTMLSVYNAIEDYLVTDMDVSSILLQIAGYEYDSSRLYTVPGEVIMGDNYEEFYVDEESFYEMYLEVFYQEVN